MCSLSFLPQGNGFTVLMNRDERKDRPRPQEIILSEMVGIEKAYPKDPSAGGTWLGVNNFGLAIALLNFYPKSFAFRESLTSRGLIIPKFLEHQEHAIAVQDFDRSSFKNFAPFRIVFLQIGRPVQIRIWSGRHLKRISRPFEMFFLASSSWSDHFVRKHRTEQFKQLMNDIGQQDLSPRDLRQFHFSRQGDQGATHLLMSRNDAQTTTISQIEVSAQDIKLSSWWNPQNQTFEELPSQQISLRKKP